MHKQAAVIFEAVHMHQVHKPEADQAFVIYHFLKAFREAHATRLDEARLPNKLSETK